MQRRRFIKFLVGMLGLSGLAPVSSSTAAFVERRTVLPQTSPVAGFQYHEGEAVWALLAFGCDVDLVRDPENPCDDRGWRIMWWGQLMDRGRRCRRA